LVTDRAGATARLWRWLGPSLAVLLVAAPAVFWNGGVVEEEAIGFLRNYWVDRPVLQRIFDPAANDYSLYQSRELSYAVDLLDALWLRALLGRGILFVVPPSAVLAGLAVVAIGLRLAPRALPSLDARTRWLVLLVFLSNFAVVSAAGLLYRATKPLVAPLLIALLLLLLAEDRAPRLRPRAAFASVLAIGLAMGLLDRQGLFYLVLLGAALAAAGWRSRRRLPLVLGVAAAVAGCLVYTYLLGPWLIHALNGYLPRMRYQRLRPSWLLDPSAWREAASLLGDWTSVLAGGLPLLLLATAAVLAGLAWAWRERARPRHLAVAAASLAVAGVAQLAMVAIMVRRHEPVTWVDHRFWYYPLPFQALVVAGALWMLDRRAARSAAALSRLAAIALAALVVSNVLQWPERRLVMESGPWFSDVSRRSALLLRSLSEGRAAPLLDGDYRRFYFECLDRFPRLGARAGAWVAEGGGIGVAELRKGRLVAAIEPESQLVASVPEAGKWVLSGGAHLGPGARLLVLLGRQPPRLIADIRREGPDEGSEWFRIVAEIPAGRSDIRLLPSGPATLLLPVSIWKARPAATRSGATTTGRDSTWRDTFEARGALGLSVISNWTWHLR
jgi:hypothetical protein